MFRIFVLAVTLFVLWTLLSGYFTGLLISLGVMSTLLTVYIVRRMGLLDDQSLMHKISVTALVRYALWLAKEIAVANLAVCKIVLAKKPNIQQSFMDVPASQNSDFAKVIYANSITLTPGTITVETAPGYFYVHALTEKAADPAALADMNHRVSNIELKAHP